MAKPVVFLLEPELYNVEGMNLYDIIKYFLENKIQLGFITNDYLPSSNSILKLERTYNLHGLLRQAICLNKIYYDCYAGPGMKITYFLQDNPQLKFDRVIVLGTNEDELRNAREYGYEVVNAMVSWREVITKLASANETMLGIKPIDVEALVPISNCSLVRSVAEDVVVKAPRPKSVTFILSEQARQALKLKTKSDSEPESDTESDAESFISTEPEIMPQPSRKPKPALKPKQQQVYSSSNFKTNNSNIVQTELKEEPLLFALRTKKIKNKTKNLLRAREKSRQGGERQCSKS